jgi:CheY-like chemotaxis protein
VARVLAFVPDLLFGSNVLGALSAAGHEVSLVSDGEGLRRGLDTAEVLVVDLTADVEDRLELVAPALRRPELRTLAFFSHVETDVRVAAVAAGFDQVVPRSRMARAGGDLVAELLAS